jgi:hypothetical protein
MPDTNTQHAAQQLADARIEGVTITAFGRLALLRSQLDAGLDDETCDRQYLLEQALDELARILDDITAAGGGHAPGGTERPALRVVASYTAPWANAVVRVAVRPEPAAEQAATGGPVAMATVAWLDASGPRAEAAFLLREAADLTARLAVGVDECAAGQGRHRQRDAQRDAEEGLQ